MRESSFTILRVRGIPIGAHWSWLFVFALVLWSLATVLVPATYPGLDGATYLAMAAVAAVVFFASVLAHELGHALRAVGEGSGSTGSPCGCSAGWPAARPARVARGRVPDRRRRSGGHGAPGGGLLAAGAGCGRLGWPDAVRGVFDYLARINLLVLGFNLVPALPLDGGRVLRAWLWRRQGSSGGCSTSAPVAGSRLTRPPNEEAGPMTQQVQTERRSPPPPTRRILQGLGSLLLIGAIFYFLLKGIDLGQVWAIRALTWLELATLAAIAGSNLCTYALVWMSVTPGLSFGRAMVMTQATTAPANTVPAPAP